MAKVQIEKFIDGKYETSFYIPVFLLYVGNHILPQSALNALSSHGINVQDILDAKKQKLSYFTTINVREYNIDKTITVSLI
jgi:hypothetical protein